MALKVYRSDSPLIVGFAAGGVIGFWLALFSCMLSGFFDPLGFELIAGAVLGSVTGAVFGPISAFFVRGMDLPKVVGCLAAGAVVPGMAAVIIGFLKTGDNPVIISWPVGILGYWAAFVFRHELVWLVNWWQRVHTGKSDNE